MLRPPHSRQIEYTCTCCYEVNQFDYFEEQVDVKTTRLTLNARCRLQVLSRIFVVVVVEMRLREMGGVQRELINSFGRFWTVMS